MKDGNYEKGGKGNHKIENHERKKGSQEEITRGKKKGKGGSQLSFIPLPFEEEKKKSKVSAFQLNKVKKSLRPPTISPRAPKFQLSLDASDPTHSRVYPELAEASPVQESIFRLTLLLQQQDAWSQRHEHASLGELRSQIEIAHVQQDFAPGIILFNF